jgi:hypothetical protein
MRNPEASRRSPVGSLARLLERGDMELLGISRTSRIGRRYNGRRYRSCLKQRVASVESHLEMLAAARGTTEGLRPGDGYLVDSSHSLPHLNEVIADMETVIAERGGQRWEDVRKIFLQNILAPGDHLRYGSLLDFVTSPEVLEPVTRLAGFVPHLSVALPRGVRLLESSTDHDPTPELWRLSQLWHIDYHATPTIYVIVAVRDIGPDDGPLHFLGAEASRRVAKVLDYGARNSPYRVTDERIEALVDPEEVHRFTAPAGTVLFLDSSRCFHFGSRNPRSRRYHLQYAYVSPVRNDFGDLLRGGLEYPIAPSDPPYRRLALDRNYLTA